MSDSIKADMAKLGYDARWLEHDLLDAARLQQQTEHYDASDDKNTEHYRYATFRHVLSRRTSLPDAEVTHYVELAERDPDRMMAGAALADLIGWPGLTPEQFERLSRHPAVQSPSLQRMFDRRRLRTELEAGHLTDELFSRCLDFRDESTHRFLLATPGLTEPQLAAIRDRGCNRAVRNVAKTRFGRSTQKAEA